uniref:Odorant binding protein 2 n=1 Tax=Agrotis ipsilon TaxID=56364 RepID=U5KEQ2_AGRIP|nr:odorant binding protein 2 [Agrotis ipsilon]
MSKFTCLVLCVVAASISRVHADDDANKAAFREAFKPILDECSKEHGVSNDDIDAAKKAGSADAIKPCFFGCIYKKAEVFNAKGEYDVDSALSKLKKFVPDEAKFAKYAEIGKKCASVNEKPVTDGDAGCERGAMLTACFLENRAEMLI